MNELLALTVGTPGNMSDLVHLIPISGTTLYLVGVLHTRWYDYTWVTSLTVFANNAGLYNFSLDEANVAVSSIRGCAQDSGEFIDRIKIDPGSGYKIAWDVCLDARFVSARTLLVLFAFTLLTILKNEGMDG